MAWVMGSYIMLRYCRAGYRLVPCCPFPKLTWFPPLYQLSLSCLQLKQDRWCEQRLMFCTSSVWKIERYNQLTFFDLENTLPSPHLQYRRWQWETRVSRAKDGPDFLCWSLEIQHVGNPCPRSFEKRTQSFFASHRSRASSWEYDDSEHKSEFGKKKQYWQRYCKLGSQSCLHHGCWHF